MHVADTLPKKYPITVTHFQKMIETGIFDEDERIELIDGELIAMAPIGPEHSSKTRRLNRQFSQTNPTAKDVFLLVEVADSSLNYDKKTKIPLYARQGIPEVWLINVPNKQVEIYRNPSPKGYRQILFPENKESISHLRKICC
jgi:Uma2 family endonuclease